MSPPFIVWHNVTVAFSCTAITAHDGAILCSWANNPSTRGTFNIIWLCLSTLGLCVWNAVHPDVPHPGTPKWRVLGKRIWWLLVGLFMPEIMVLTALAQFRLAYMLLVRVRRDTSVPTEVPWWMRAIERLWPTSVTLETVSIRPAPSLRESDPAALPSLPDVELDDIGPLLPTRASDAALPASPPVSEAADKALQGARRHPWTLTHSFYAVMHGFLGADGDAFWTTRETEYGGYLRTTFDADKGIQHIVAASHDTPRIPDLSADDLDDRSKAGAVAKALLVWQFSVFIANCAARWNQGLPLSLIEITTLAHSLCSLIALGLWWYKPHGIGEATVIDGTHSPPPPPKISWINRATEKVAPNAGDIDLPRTITILGITALYGLPHLLGLSVHFPTAAEQFWWKFAAFTVISSPLFLCVLLLMGLLEVTYGLTKVGENASQLIIVFIFFLAIVAYSLASMFLVGESMRQVFALSQGCFLQPRLTRYLPSFS